jgi:putative membrane protein
MTDLGYGRLRWFLLLSGAALLIWSGVGPRDRLTWVMEIAPAVIGGVLLAATARRFPLSTLVYALLWIFALILMVGGHWTYAEVPLGNWLRDALGLSRNHFDRLGHFFQGLAPAMLAREVLLRTSPLRPGKWLFFIVLCIALAISAMYEFVEWFAALSLGQSADMFLGSQGDPWDTQWDMFLAFCGAIVGQLALSRAHGRSLRRVCSA